MFCVIVDREYLGNKYVGLK